MRRARLDARMCQISLDVLSAQFLLGSEVWIGLLLVSTHGVDFFVPEMRDICPFRKRSAWRTYVDIASENKGHRMHTSFKVC